MSCTAAALTYTGCGHTTRVRVSCHCSLGREHCDTSQSRVIFQANFIGKCPVDVQQHLKQEAKEFCACVRREEHAITRVTDEKIFDSASERAPDSTFWKNMCYGLVNKRYKKFWELKEKKLDMMAKESREVLPWVREVSAAIYCIMFGPKASVSDAEEILARVWTEKPAGVTVIEHGMLSEAQLKQIQGRLELTGRRKVARAVLEAIRVSKKPPVPRFPPTIRTPKTPARHKLPERPLPPGAPPRVLVFNKASREVLSPTRGQEPTSVDKDVITCD